MRISEIQISRTIVDCKLIKASSIKTPLSKSGNFSETEISFQKKSKNFYFIESGNFRKIKPIST